MPPIKLKAAAKEDKDMATPELPVTTAHIGETLRQAREARHIKIEGVADELMIRRYYLDALEHGNFKDLPERVYAIGFVRNYALHVGLDAEAAVEQFKRDAYGTRSGASRIELTMPEPVIQSVVPSRNAMMLGIIAVVMLGVGIFFSTRKPTVIADSVPTPPPAVEQQQAEIAAPTPAVASPNVPSPITNSNDTTGFDMAPSATATPSPEAMNDTAAKKEIFLLATQSAWVEVKDAKGVVLFSSILKQGQKLPIPDQPGMTMTTGNARGVHLVVNGADLPPLGNTSDVKRNMAVDALLTKH